MAAARKPAAAAADPDTGLADASCRCGKDVGAVAMAGDTVVVDRDQDPAGEIRGFKLGGRWVFTLAITDGVNAPAKRHRRHRCPFTMQAEMRRNLDARDTEGPCAGHCGRGCPCGCKGRVPRRYGPNANTMCDGCSDRRDATLGLPAKTRPALPPS